MPEPELSTTFRRPRFPAGCRPGPGADVRHDELTDEHPVVHHPNRKEGKVAHIGWANDLPPLPVIPIMAKTLTVYGVGGNGGRGQYERSIELVRSGRIDLAPLVTHTFALSEIAEAFHVASTKADGAIKVLLTPPAYPSMIR